MIIENDLDQTMPERRQDFSKHYSGFFQGLTHVKHFVFHFAFNLIYLL